jgi:hypothetical protein
MAPMCTKELEKIAKIQCMMRAQEKVTTNMVTTILKKATIFEDQSYMTIFTIHELHFDETKAYFKFCKSKELQKL